MAGKSAWETGMEFFERWETGRLLAPEGAKWIAKKKVQGLKPGVSHIENKKDGRKVVVYNVPVEGPQKKGKKETDPGDWFVQVTEPDPHCWKSMEALTDNEKCRLLNKVLNCEVVWVQTGSSSLAKQGKLGMQEAVQLVKCDCILVRLWNFYQFKHENRPDSDWTTKYPFLKKREVIFAKFEGQGLDAALWDGSRKLVSDSSLFKDCPPYMVCEDDKSIKATEKLVQNKKLSIDWKNKVLCVLTGSRLKSMEVALAEGVVHIMWNDSKDVITIAPFDIDPLDAQMKVVELQRAVGITKCHTCVLDLCEPVDIKQWTAKVFESLNALLEHLFPSHWTVVTFVPREHDYYFMTSLHHLSVVKAMAGKWVRRTQKKKSFGVGHNLYSLDDRMYILFKGNDMRENTSVVYDARLAAGDAAAVGALQKVTPTEIFDMPFDACESPVVIHGRDPVVYKGMERNPTQFAYLLEFLCKKGDGIMFLGKAHAQVVWEVLKGGRNVIALEGNSEWLQFTLDFLKTAVNSGAYRCEFITKSEKPRRVWDPSTNMWFKLSARKRSRIYEFLFLEKRPARGTDIEHMRRKEHMLALLDNYHGAARLNAKNFLDRLELLYFVESEPFLRLESYGALIDADKESLTGVVFDTGAPEEDSDTEEIDIDYHLAPVLPSPASSSASPSTNRPAQATPVRRTPSKLLARLTPRPAAPPPLRPGCQVPLQHPSRKDENIHFEGHDRTRSTEVDWGHDMIWHPGTIQPAIRKGEWVMAIVDTDGEWKPSERLAKSDYLDIARSAVVDKVTSKNSNLQPAGLAIIATADRLFRELYDKQWLELSDDFYDLETSPSKKKVTWKVPPSTGTQGSVGGRPPSPPGAGGGGGNGHEEGGGGGSGHTTSGGSAPASSPAPGSQGRIAHSGMGEGGVNVTHSPTAGSGKSGKFACIRTSQTEDPVPVEAAKSTGIRTSTTMGQAALPSWTAFGSSGAQASEMGAALAVREATPPILGQGRSAESQREIAGAAPSAFLATKSAGIRTSSMTCLQSEDAGTEEGGTTIHTDDRCLGSALMRLQEAESRETDGGEEWVQVEGWEEEGEWEEGEEGDEGREKVLITLRDGEDGEEGGLSITNEERVDAGDEDVCGETSDSFGLVYVRPGEGDIDDDATAMDMEMQVVSGLSVDHEEYDAHHLATAVHPPGGCDEAIMTVSPAKTTRRLSVNEVIDSILGDVQAKTLPSTPSKDDALLINDTFAVGDLALIQPCFPVPSSPLTGGRGGVVGGRQHVTSPKKCRVGTPALAVLALPAPTSPTKERKEKQAARATAPAAWGGHFATAIAPRVSRVMDDVSRSVVPPHHVLSSFANDQFRITAKDMLTVLQANGKINDEVVNLYMALLGSTTSATRARPSGRGKAQSWSSQKLDELYANKMLEFRAPFYVLKTTPSRGIDWHMPQPPSGGQHPGGGVRGDGGDGAGPDEGGDGGDGSGSGGDEAKGKGPGETSSEPKGSDGKRSGEKGLGRKGSGRKWSGGNGSGGKGPGRKGLGGKRRAFRSHESSGTESRLLEGRAAGVLETRASEYDRYASEGASIDFKSKSVADSGEEELSQDTHVVHQEEETQHWPPRRVLDDLDAGVLETGSSGHLRHPSEGASVDLESKSTPPPGEEELSQEAHVVQREDETQNWPPHEVREGLDVGLFETNASEPEHQCHAPEGASVNVESKSASTLGEEDLSQEAHAVQRDRAATFVQGPSVGVLETEASECQGHALEEAHVVQRDEELLQGSSGNAINIRDTDLVLHSGSPLTSQGGDDKGSRGTFVEGRDRGREGRAWTFWEARLRGDEEGEEEHVLETRLHDDDEGEGAVGEAPSFGGDMSARLHDDDAGEKTVWEAQLYASEVSARQIGSKRTDHNSTSTNYGEEQGDRASALSSGREMVLHEATELVSDLTAIELVSDSAVVEMQNIESSTDVGIVTR
ncbi:hypothetical protein CBR_g17741 [Chara braunii]|uniref:Uncharacterized protein n=1 Tax=Chara braunii TaxID=69332 RepID=A0A388KVC6_CHABU|nr:hypothetical protein CBR_g17741 [Chara braunii]|eukprot:GBG74030.1 hypothetical protein CBR_g17741 [Chara braunii]